MICGMLAVAFVTPSAHAGGRDKLVRYVFEQLTRETAPAVVLVGASAASSKLIPVCAEAVTPADSVDKLMKEVDEAAEVATGSQMEAVSGAREEGYRHIEMDSSGVTGSAARTIQLTIELQKN